MMFDWSEMMGKDLDNFPSYHNSIGLSGIIEFNF